jgi:hypothetical protein
VAGVARPRVMKLFCAGNAIALPRCVISVEWLDRQCRRSRAVHDALIPGFCSLPETYLRLDLVLQFSPCSNAPPYYFLFNG